MIQDSIYKSFYSVESTSADGESYKVHSIDGMLHKLGKSQEGYPKFFVATKPSKLKLHNLNGEILSVEYNVYCSLLDDKDAVSDAIYSIVTLRTTDDFLVGIFLEITSMMLLTLPEYPSDYELSLKVEGLLSIFAALKEKPVDTAQGLWAELLVIDQSKNPEMVANAWHNSPQAKYDFTLGEEKIEVKSTASEDRIHSFSLDQLNPSASSKLLIASVIVRESGKGKNGLSVNDLYSSICKRIASADTRLHINEVIKKTLKSDYSKADSIYFDYVTGKDSLAFYDYIDVPKIEKSQVPNLVSRVRFDSNLSALNDVFQKGYIFDKQSLFGQL